MKKALILTLILTLCCLLPVGVLADPPPNDDCAYATDAGTLVAGETEQLSGTTIDATDDCGEDSVPEVWVKFTIESCMDVTIDFCDDPSNPTSSSSIVYGGCPCNNASYASEWGICSSNDSPSLTWNGLQAGTYYYSIEDNDGKAGSYVVNITGVDCPPPPENDDCEDATDAGTLVADQSEQLSGSAISATQDCGELWNPEVWIKFTITSCMDVTIDYCDDMNMVYSYINQLYSECPCGGALENNNLTYCGMMGNPSLTWYNLEAGTYYYPIISEGDYTVNVTGTDCPLLPDNDDCGDAAAIGEVSELDFSTRGAVYDGSGNCISEGPNIWFVYTPSFTGTALIELSETMFNIQMAVYDGYSCSPLPTELGCTSETRFDIDVVTGQQYLIEIGSQDGSSGNGRLTINEAPDTPSNDDCTDADDGGTLQSGVPVQYTGNSTGATLDCDVNMFSEVWIQFTVESCMNVTIDYCDDNSSIWQASQNLHTDCDCYNYLFPSQSSSCENNNPVFVWYDIQPGTYYYPVWATNGIGGPYTVNVTGVDCPEPPDPDFVITAPYSGMSTTCGAGNDCYLQYEGEDQIYEVTIPTTGNWYFSLCNSASQWMSAVYLGASICENDINYIDADCGNGHHKLFVSGLEAGIYYLTIDSYSGFECGSYTLDIDRIPDPCEDSYYTNGGPNYEGAVESFRDTEYGGEYYACDDFTITEDITLQSVKFICAASNYNEPYFNDAADYQIIANDGGVPGEVLYESTGAACTRVSTGYEYGEGFIVYAYQLDNLDIELPAGTYSLACRTESSPTYWLTTDSQTGSTAYYKIDDGAWTISEVYGDLAFCLFGTTNGNTYEYLPGDANMAAGSWPPNVIGADVTYLVNYFRAIAAPCLVGGFYNSADANGDCSVIGADVTYLVQYFRGAGDLQYCPDYETAWPTPEDLPIDAPSGWPNCE